MRKSAERGNRTGSVTIVVNYVCYGCQTRAVKYGGKFVWAYRGYQPATFDVYKMVNGAYWIDMKRSLFEGNLFKAEMNCGKSIRVETRRLRPPKENYPCDNRLGIAALDDIMI